MRRIALYVVSLMLVLTFLAVSSSPAAHAASRSDSALSHLKHAASMKPQNLGTMDNDVFIIVADNFSTPSYISFAAEGRLTLVAKNGSTTSFGGTFTDNFGGGKVYPASLQTDNSTYYNFVVNTHAGKFTLNMTNSSPTSIVPKKFGPSVAAIEFSNAHMQQTTTLTATVGNQSYGFQPKATGILTVVSDGNGFIIPNNKKLGITSGFAYSMNGKSAFSPLTAPGVFHPIDVNFSNEGQLDALLKIGSVTYGIHAEQPGTDAEIDGNAYGSAGANSAILTFIAK